jgi:8-oxo-dGTP diphosphatase
MARALIVAAGGIVLRREGPARIAVVRLRKRNEWVLPKGKLDDGETPRAAAEREVLEETGHDVSVHEFLGTLVYEAGGRAKAVHFWRMEAGGDQIHELMHDVKAVDWLSLGDAVERLSRSSERAFLENVGPIAVQAAAQARATERLRMKRPAADELAGAAVGPDTPSLSPIEPGTVSQETSPGLQSTMMIQSGRLSTVQRVQHWLRRVITSGLGGIQ